MEIDDTVLTASEQDVARMEFGLSKHWLTVAAIAMLAGLILLAGRLVQLSLAEGDTYRATAAANSTRYEIVAAPRGRIYDTTGTTLVENVPQIDLITLLTRESITDTDGQIGRLADMTGVTADDMRARIVAAQAAGQGAAVVVSDLSQEAVAKLLAAKDTLRDVQLVSTARRRYADALAFGHLLGYTGIVRKEDLERDPTYLRTDQIGKAGIEKSHEDALRGVHGRHGVEVDARGRARRVAEDSAPVPGDDLYLTIDAALQRDLYDTLARLLEEHGLDGGAAVAVDPRDGAVRALVSVPGYDTNLFVGGIGTDAYRALADDPHRPLFNRAVAGAYPPGSTVKPFLGAAALDAGIITEDTTVNSTGAIRVGAYTFRDWNINGLANVRRAIAVSHDIFFYAVGGGYGPIAGLGIDRMKHYYNLFGFGRQTGIDLPGEADGFIPDAQWKRDTKGEPWTIGNSYHAAIGQGYITATPLQIVAATAAVANGGTLWRPYLVAERRSMDGTSVRTAPESVTAQVLGRGIVQVAREGMRMTITEEGTARSLASLPVPIAGKTGTAQYGSEGKTHLWFSSFAPYDQPQLALVVLAEGAGPSTPSVPIMVTREVLTRYFTRAK